MYGAEAGNREKAFDPRLGKDHRGGKAITSWVESMVGNQASQGGSSVVIKCRKNPLQWLITKQPYCIVNSVERVEVGQRDASSSSAELTISAEGGVSVYGQSLYACEFRSDAE